MTADTKTVSLGQAQADFALNPDTGAIASVDADAGTATLFRKAFFGGNTKAVVGPVRVGSTPCSIICKRFGKKVFFAVVCTQISYMYVLDGESFDLVKKIMLSSAGVSSLTCSTNPEDPIPGPLFRRGSRVDVRCGRCATHDGPRIDLRQFNGLRHLG